MSLKYSNNKKIHLKNGLSGFDREENLLENVITFIFTLSQLSQIALES